MLSREYTNSIAPLIRDMNVWNAFLFVLDKEQEKLIDKLKGEQSSTDALIRINAQFVLLERLKKVRDNAIS